MKQCCVPAWKTVGSCGLSPGASRPRRAGSRAAGALHAPHHVLHLLAVQQLHNKREELVLGQLGLLQDGLHGSEVGLNLLLDILVHAELGLVFGAALHVHLDLAELDGAEGLAGDDGVVGDVGGQVGGHLVAGVQDLLVLLSEPGTGQLVLLHVGLHGLDVDVVAGIKAVHLTENAGHVSDLGLHVALLLSELLHQPVSEVKVLGIHSPGVPRAVVGHEVGHASHRVVLLVAVGVAVGVHGVGVNLVHHLAEHVHHVRVGVVAVHVIGVVIVLTLHHLLHHVHVVRALVVVLAVGPEGIGLVVVVVVVPVVLHHGHHLGEHDNHVVHVLVLVGLVDHGVDEP